MRTKGAWPAASLYSARVDKALLHSAAVLRVAAVVISSGGSEEGA